MPIKYACIYEGKELLADFPPKKRNLAKTMQKVIATIPPNEYQRKVVEDNEGGVNYSYISNDKGCIVACVTTSDMREGAIFYILEEFEGFYERIKVGPESDLGTILLRYKIGFYNDPKRAKILEAFNQIHDSVEILRVDLNVLLARGEGIDTLNEMSGGLQESFAALQTSAGTLKRQALWRRVKLVALIVVPVILLIIIILLIACKPDFSRCR